jgi:hypothetical protein
VTDDTIYIALTRQQADKVLYGLPPGYEVQKRSLRNPLSAEQVARQWLTENGHLLGHPTFPITYDGEVGRKWWVPDGEGSGE